MSKLTNYQKEVLKFYSKDYLIRKSEYKDFMSTGVDFNFAKYVRLSEAVDVARACINAVSLALSIVQDINDDYVSFYDNSFLENELLRVNFSEVHNDNKKSIEH